MILKAYKYRLNPKNSQFEILNKHLGCARYIYNWALSKKTALYKKDKTNISCYDLIKQVTQLKKQTSTSWLSEVNSQSLQQSLLHLDSAYKKFFREKRGFPKFKSRYNHNSFSCPQGVKVNWNNSTIQLPKIGKVKFWNSRRFEGYIKTCTVSRTARGQYFISILVETTDNYPLKPEITEDSIGIDLGLIDFAALSTGEKIQNPRYLSKNLKKLKVLQRRHSRKVKRSNRRRKHCRRLAKVHEKVRNQRNDFLHKLSSRLISENQTIFLEDLNVRGMMQNHKLARSISDVSWSKFVEYLKYKSEWYGTNVVQINRFAPSTKKCSCGYINNDLTLSDREWTCPECKTKHDRDIHSANNVKEFGLEKYLYSGTGCPGERRELSIC